MCNFWNYSEATEIVHFCGKRKEGIFGQAEDGIIVFVDRDMGVQVGEGETWICRLSKNRNPDKKIYWAWPIEKLEKREEKAGVEAAKETGTTGTMTAEEGITAEGQDRISSEMFTGGRYMAYRSLNGAFMELIEDPAGDIVCKDGSMAIEGLDVFIGTQFPVALVFTRREDRFLIKLEQ